MKLIVYNNKMWHNDSGPLKKIWILQNCVRVHGLNFALNFWFRSNCDLPIDTTHPVADVIHSNITSGERAHGCHTIKHVSLDQHTGIKPRIIGDDVGAIELDRNSVV